MNNIIRYIYKITCTAGTWKDKFYYGQHTTKNINDEYKGSGRKLGCYYKKYPNEYIKEIVAFYDSQEELNKAEYELIHQWLGNEMCLNISEGGWGGSHPAWNKGIKMSEDFCKKSSEGQKRRYKNTEERKKAAKRSMGNTNMKTFHKKNPGAFKGENNPMYGKNIKDYMSPEKYEQHNKNISKSLKGHKGIKLKEVLSPERYEQFRNNLSKSLNGHEGFNKNYKTLNDKYIQVSVNWEEVGEFIDIGFTFGRIK